MNKLNYNENLDDKKMKIYSKTIKKQNKTKSSHNLDLSRQVINLLTKKNF